MSTESRKRLAILRGELEVTQRVLAQRSGLSTVYLKMLESGQRPITRRVAMAFSVATSAGVGWLLGEGKRRPIVTDYGAIWTKEISEAIQCSKRDKRATIQEAAICNRLLTIYHDRLGRLLSAAFQKKKTFLAVALIEESLSKLEKKFKPASWWFVRNPEKETADVAARLKRDLNAEIERRPYSEKIAASKPAKPPRR